MTGRVDIPDAEMRGAYIVAGALIAGALIFLGIVLVLVHVVKFAAADTSPIISLIGVVLVVAETVPFAFVDKLTAMAAANQPHVSQTQNIEPGTIEAYLGQYRGRMILRHALCEGACFLNTLAYLLEQNWWTLGVISGLLLVMVAMFPTHTKLEHWIETQQIPSQAAG